MRATENSQPGEMATVVRIARPGDAVVINEIYNHYVLHSTCTYQDKPESIESRQRWLGQHDPAVHPVIVAEQCGHVIAWGALSAFHSRSAYRHTVENSIYVQHDHRRRGIGSKLLRELIARARVSKHHAMMALIDGSQDGSVALHARFGFERVGFLRQVGFKFERWLDVIYMELLLESHS